MSAIEPTEKYPHIAALRSGRIVLHWKIIEGIMTMEVHGETLGWLGIGFSSNGGMAGADIVVGWVGDGTAYITDRHGLSNRFPPKDVKQDVEIVAGRERGGWTMLKFRRHLAACEDYFDREITADTQRIIWALGETDPVGEDLRPNEYHGLKARGVQSLLLLDPADSLRMHFSEEEKVSTLKITNKNLIVPPAETYYHCKLVELPEFTTKHHIIKARPIITKGNEFTVHHMLLYQCGNSLKDRSDLETEGACYSPEMPSHYATCQTMVAGFAIGGGEFYFPPNAGYPLGGENGSRYMQIQIHYDNPLLREDIIDSSGVEITYTSNVRTFDTGMLMLGNTVDGFQHFIPPNSERFTTTGHCTSNCLAEAMSFSKASKINIFSSLLHTHIKGRAIHVRHVRNGTELPYIAKDDTYDYNYQEIRYTTGEREVLPSDLISVQCTYNTTGARSITMGGSGVKEEMCIAFLFYYPKIDLIDCTSVPISSESYPIFNILNYNITGYNGIMDVHVTEPIEYSGMSGMEVMNMMDWNESSTKVFSEKLAQMTQYQQCSGYHFNGQSKGNFNPPVILQAYNQPKLECKQRIANLTPVATCSSTMIAIHSVIFFFCLCLSLHIQK